MSDRPTVEELRRSLSVLRTEWWLPVGGLVGCLLYGVWVVATSRAVDAVAPALGATTVGAVGATPVTGFVVFAAVAWLLAPAAVVAWSLDRRLSNNYGNLASQYRLDHPGALPVLPGAVVLLAGVVAVALGPRPPVVAVMAVASAHLFVRTVAFGRRVYSFSPRPLFPVLTAVSAVALAAAWLVGATGLPAPVGPQVASAGVPAVVATGLAVAGVGPATALAWSVAVPALLSGAYLAVQRVAARRVMARAPLSNPQKRAEQRYPIMPPVPDSSRPGTPTAAESAPAPDAATAVDSPAPTDSPDRSSDTGRSDTRVFTADDPSPEAEDAVAAVGGEGDRSTDDGWIDDTAIFSPEGAGGSSEDCGACGESLPGESVTFCPNCGKRL